jgi:hypothetical protein
MLVACPVAVGTALSTWGRAAPRADPSERDYRTGLLPRVLASKRSLGHAWRTRAGGSHRAASTLARCQVVRSRWLRRRSARSQWRATWVRNARIARRFVGTA